MTNNSIKTAVIIGAGNVAWHLGKALQAANIQLLGVANRTETSGKALAKEFNTPYYNISSVPTDADLYLLALSDEAITEISEKLPKNSGIVVHHSGSMPMNAISKKHDRKGVFYCLQTFKKSVILDFSTIPILVQAKHDSDFELLTEMAKKLSSDIRTTSDIERSNLHVAAVFACNFSNYLYSVAYQFANDKQLDFNLLVPLIQRTANQISGNEDPFHKQTGPAIRNDLAVIEKHLKMLENDSNKQALYRQLTDEILQEQIKRQKSQNEKL